MVRIIYILGFFAYTLMFTSVTAEYLAPSPYLSFDSNLAGVSISPFANKEFTSFFLEDFEDGALNTPGVTIQEFSTTNINTAYSDSVDGDDGVIDGFATGQTRSLFSNFTTSSFTFVFSALELNGVLPTHAGIVWTDIGRNNGGTPFASDLINNTTFEAFDALGNSLGLFGPFSFGDSSISRTTDEDRFIGVINLDGISAIKISMPGKNNWEVDHLQYGTLQINDVAKRAEIAKPILQAIYGSDYIPTEATGVIYSDVQQGDFNAGWIEKLAADGITEGCAVGRFCPDFVVNKEQLSKILLKSKFGTSYSPPIASGIFADVDINNPDAGWIEGLVNQGITEGCDVDKFCPNEVVTQATFKVMLNKTFP